MDSTQNENRYAFCAGDPINLFDGTGPSESGAMIAGLVAGTAATVIAGLLTGGIAATVFGADVISASIAAGAVSGAAGNVVGHGTQAAVNHENYTIAQEGMDFVSGALAGAIGAGSGGTAGRATMVSAIEKGFSRRAVAAIGSVVSGSIGGAAGGFAGGASMAMMTGQPLFSSETALSMVTGALGGLGGGILESGSYLHIIDNRVLPLVVSRREYEGGTARFEAARNRTFSTGGTSFFDATIGGQCHC